MFNGIFASQPVAVLEKALAGSAVRHKVIANNVANVNTPGFKRGEVSFENELAEASRGESRQGMTVTHVGHISVAARTSAPRVTSVTNTSMRTDGNNVDIDAEMAAMTKNNIFYNAVAQRIGGYYQNLKTVINAK